MPEKERVQHLRELSSKVLNTMAKTLALVVERAVQESYQEMVTPLEQPPDA
jgi:hypothetical protein